MKKILLATIFLALPAFADKNDNKEAQPFENLSYEETLAYINYLEGLQEQSLDDETDDFEKIFPEPTDNAKRKTISALRALDEQMQFYLTKAVIKPGLKVGALIIENQDDNNTDISPYR